MPKYHLIPSECKICGAYAYYSYYGVKACESCKMFFKRNGNNEQKQFRCHWNGQCEVNCFNRQVCPACRLDKCFQVGMSTDMFRSCRAMKRKRDLSLSTEIIRWKNNTSQQIRRLNLLEQDQSLLNSDQWILLSNLIYSYDEHNALQIAQDFKRHLTSLHPKLRLKIDSQKILEILNVFYTQTEPFILSNHDFALLSCHDRSIILRGAADNVSCLAGAFLLRQSGLITESAFCQALEDTYGSIAINLTLTEVTLLDDDINIIKLTLCIFAFCTSHCTLFHHKNNSLIYLTNQQSILHIQNMYAELIWKYLLYKYSFEQAVRRFTHLVQCLILALTIRTHIQSVRNHTDAVDALIEKIEQRQQINIYDN